MVELHKSEVILIELFYRYNRLNHFWSIDCDLIFPSIILYVNLISFLLNISTCLRVYVCVCICAGMLDTFPPSHTRRVTGREIEIEREK